jgi:hypothetical protein
MTARARAPKAEDYSVVPGSLGPRRDFRISVGLREGDADGRVLDVSEAVRTARAWMKRRVEAGQPALSGMFTRAEVTYAWPRPDGTVGSDREPVAQFTGEAVHTYLGHLSDETIEAMLNELSIELGAALGQERIYVAFTGPGFWMPENVRSGLGLICRFDNSPLGACPNSRCSILSESDSSLSYEQVFSPLEYRSDTAAAAECAGLRAERPCLAVYR